MLQRVKTYIDRGSTWYGLEIFDRGSVRYFLSRISLSKGELLVDEPRTFAHLDALFDHLKKEIPVVVTINTKEVLTKTVENRKMTPPEEMVNRVFPNIDFSNFYYAIASTGSLSQISIAKKEKINGFLGQLEAGGVSISGFSLGSSQIGALSGHIGEGVVYTSDKKITFQSHAIAGVEDLSSLEAQGMTNHLNGLQVPATHTLGFVGVLSRLAGYGDVVANYSEENRAYDRERVGKRRLQLLLRTSLLFFLGLLLVNFLVFSYYFGKVETLNNAMTINEEEKKTFALLKQGVAQKERKVNAILSGANSKTTYFMDRIASGVPESVLLSSLVLQPLGKPMQSNKPVQLREKQILITGLSQNSEAFSSWMGALESEPWTKEIEVVDYDHEKNETFAFSIRLMYDEHPN